MSTPERAFTLQLMQECEIKDGTINSLVAIAQLQYNIAALEGHPFPTPPLQGQVPPEQVQAMIDTLQVRFKELQHTARNGQVIDITGKVNEHGGRLENANALIGDGDEEV